MTVMVYARREKRREPRGDGSRTTISSMVLLTLAGLSACGTPTLTNMEAGAPNSSATCAPVNVDPTRYLRQLSLDLRGTPPTVEELEQVATAGEVAPAMIDSMLATPEFSERVRTWHRSLLWPTLEAFRIRTVPISAWPADRATGRKVPSASSFSPDPALVDPANPMPDAVVSFAGNGASDRPLRGGPGVTGCDPNIVYPAPDATGTAAEYSVRGTDGMMRTYRYYDRDGVPLPYHDALHCPNYCSSKTDAERSAPGARIVSTDFAKMDAAGADPAPHELDPAGMHCPATHPNRVVNPCDNAIYNGADLGFRERRDGIRNVTAYWTEGRTVAMCAYEAQTRSTSVLTGQDCAGRQLADASCGCGPEGRFCMPAVNTFTNTPSRAEFRVRDALNNEPLQIVSSVVERDEDYFNIFTTRRSFVTGATVYLYKQQLASLQGLEIGAPAPMDAIPDVAYTDTQWHEFVRNPEHAGVLTTPAYLGRFPTWRARVSQFRQSFMCRPFYNAATSFPPPDDSCTREPNLARRCGCQNCHAAIEPMTAWFGRWAERSAKFLPEGEFPSFDPNCQLCAINGTGCTTRCRTHYVIDTFDADGARFAGTLRSYLYRTGDEESRINEGVQGLVQNAAASGELSQCTVRNAWNSLMGRAMSEDEMRTLLPDFTARFNANGHNYRALVKDIVSSVAYRRVD